jgi:hypothetical protein
MEDGVYYSGMNALRYSSSYARPSDQMLPFDELSTSIAYKDGQLLYTVTPISNFNSINLSGVLGDDIEVKVISTIDAGDTEVQTKILDTKIDSSEYLPKAPQTLLFKLDKYYVQEGGIVPEYRVEITINGAKTSIGNIATGVYVDEGVTDFKIRSGIKDYNNYTPDGWGQIPTAVKAKTKNLNIKVTTTLGDNLDKFKNYNMLLKRHTYMKGRFATIDPTDGQISSLVIRGLILDVSHNTSSIGAQMADTFEYDMNFLEVV